MAWKWQGSGFRTGGKSEDETRRIVALLQERERWHVGKSVALLICGIPLSLVGPCTITGMFWLANFLSRTGWPIPWGWVFCGLTVTMVPILIRMAYRSTADDFDRAVRESDVHVPHRGLIFVSGTFPRVLAGVAVAANAGLIARGFTDVFLAGPRMAVAWWRQTQMAKSLGCVDLARVAEIVRLLFGVDGGIDPGHALRPEETAEDRARLLAYLVHYGWIGVRGDGQRIWLTSSAKGWLEKQLLTTQT